MLSRCLLLMFLLNLFCAGDADAQTALIDSVKKNIGHAKSAQNKLNAVLALCEQRQSLNTDTLFYYASLGRKMAITLKDEENIALANYFVSNSLSRKGELDEALDITNANLEKLSYQKNKNAYTKFSI
jgi:hypothetical protein